MAKSSLVMILLVTLVGCDRAPNLVHFVLPDGYRGPFAIKPDDPMGNEVKKTDGKYIIDVPENGIFKLKGFDPFRSYLGTAVFKGGKTILIRKAPKGEVGLWDMPTQAFYDEDGKAVNFYWWFVGTENEWKEVRKAGFQYKVGGIKKEEPKAK